MKIAAIGYSHKLIREINQRRLINLVKTNLQVFDATEIITALHPHLDLALGIAAMEMGLPVRVQTAWYNAFADWPEVTRKQRCAVALHAYQTTGDSGAIKGRDLSMSDDNWIAVCNGMRLKNAHYVFTFAIEGAPGGTQDQIEELRPYISGTEIVNIWDQYFA